MIIHTSKQHNEAKSTQIRQKKLCETTEDKKKTNQLISSD